MHAEYQCGFANKKTRPIERRSHDAGSMMGAWDNGKLQEFKDVSMDRSLSFD